MSKFRWGILSTAGIGRKNWRAIFDSGNGVLAAVASRDAAKARKFIDDMQKEFAFDPPPAAIGSYEELIASRDIDAVYVPLPTGLRKEWVLRAAAAGKHVLCEKPCGVNAAAVREMTAACARHRVQFMDGVMFMHGPRMGRMREVLDDGKSVGAIKRIMSSFSFMADAKFFDGNIRAHSDLEPAGCLGDLGWYCARYALWAMNWRPVIEAKGRVLNARGSKHSPGAPPVEYSGELIFDGGASLGFYCSFQAQYQNWVNVSGDKGWLRVDDFVHPVNSHEPSFWLNGVEERVKACDCTGAHTASRAMAHEALMMRNFANQARSGKLNDDWPMWALKTQEALDALQGLKT